MPTNAQALSDALDAILTTVEDSALAELAEFVLPLVGDVGDAADDGLSFLEGARQSLAEALSAVDPAEDLGDALVAALSDHPLVELAEVNEAGGEALANTGWMVHNQGGDTVIEKTGAFPSFVLAEGEYSVIATHHDKIYKRDFSVAAGHDKDVEVIVGAQ